MNIVSFKGEYQEETVEFILGVLRNELGASEDVLCTDEDDLKDITKYQKNKSNFWLALDPKIVGTIALLNYNNGRGYLKRMYVAKKYRGTGLAQKMLQTLIIFAQKNGYKQLFLGTMDFMKAANKFYQKEGFKRAKLPKDMPTFDDTIFYKMNL